MDSLHDLKRNEVIKAYNHILHSKSILQRNRLKYFAEEPFSYLNRVFMD